MIQLTIKFAYNVGPIFLLLISNVGFMYLSKCYLIFTFLLPIFLYILFTLFLIYKIYSFTYKKISQNIITYRSILKDREFLIFKDNLFKIYYSTIIILLYFLFKNNFIIYLLLSNTLFIYLVLFYLFFLFSILLSNSFILNLFHSYLELKRFINELNELKFEPLEYSIKNKKIHNFNVFYSQVRNFSTLNNNNNNNNSLNDDNNSLEKAIAIKNFKKNYKGGYLGYNQVHHFGNAREFAEILEKGYSLDKLELKLHGYLNEIPEDVIYSVLPVLRWEYSNGDYKSISITQSIKISRGTSRKLLAKKICFCIKDAISIYDIQSNDIDLFMMSRPWLRAEDFSIEYSNITEILDDQIEKEISSWSESSVKYISDKQVLNKIYNLKNYPYKDSFMDNYGEPLLDPNKILVGYRLTHNEYASISTYYNNKGLLCNKISVKDMFDINLPFHEHKKNEGLISWVDTRTEFGFIREYNKRFYFYDKSNNLFNVEVPYLFNSFPTCLKKIKELSLDLKIGTLDFETYGSDLGMGYQQVYAGGWAIKNKSNLFYKNKKESDVEFINKVFLNILMNPKLNGYTFYAHNLGRFDSIFIIKALIENKNIKLTPIWKDNSILSLKIKYNNIEIVLLDSLQLISGSLGDILDSFNCTIKKSQFPYSFVNKDNLFYIGEKPSKFYFNNISDLDYNSIPNDNWDLKKETLNYLKSDIEGLLEALVKFNYNIFSNYQLNITSFKTLSGLALATYLTSYLPEHLKSELKIIKGDLERELRSSYFGGNVEVYINKIEGGYLYDINSQYSKAMLNDMPVGDPVFSLEKNLNNIFGFVYGEIHCPDEQTLQVPFIQHKNPITDITYCPRGKFSRLIFSEEIKYALKFGYKLDIKYCYQFKRGKDLFKDYILAHYEIKKNSKDPIQRSVAKLFLNSLYGRLGMKDIENTLKIVDKKEAEILDKNTNVTVISELSENKFMVRYNGKISDNIRKLYSKDPLILKKNKTITYNKEQLRDLNLIKKAYVPSAVHIAAAITSYARMIINEYKNIPGNPCIMSDTDSAVLTKPLSDHLVGNGLGQMKLVHKIKTGIFIRKKLYYILDSNNKEIIKSSGIDSSHLDYNLFKNLLNGETVQIKRNNFKVEWKELNVNYVSTDISIQGLIGEIKTIYNTKDVNLKFISLPATKKNSIIPYYYLNKSERNKIIPYVSQNNNKFITLFTLANNKIIVHPLFPVQVENSDIDYFNLYIPDEKKMSYWEMFKDFIL